jgi:hypothetical protein
MLFCTRYKSVHRQKYKITQKSPQLFFYDFFVNFCKE